MRKSTKITIGGVVLILIIFISIGRNTISENNPQFQQLLQEVEKQTPGIVAPSSIDISLIPMYGGFEKTDEQKRTDKEFVDGIVEIFGSKKEASFVAINKAKESFEKGDLDMSMRRYNQAWLLDENNPEIYTGFGDIFKKRGDIEEATDMYRRAEDLNNNI